MQPAGGLLILGIVEVGRGGGGGGGGLGGEGLNRGRRLLDLATFPSEY